MSTQVIKVQASAENDGGSDSPRAVVLLMGWWGAELRHVEKYAQLYQEKGCATVTVLADKIQVMTHLCYPSLDNCVREASHHVAEIIRSNEKDGKRIPVILHAFSNAGTFLVERLEVLVQQARTNLKSKGCEDLVFVGDRLSGEIFDSAPAYPDMKLGFTSTNGVVFGNSIVARIIVGLIFALAGFISLLLNFILGLPDVRWSFWNNMREGRTCLKQAFVYSTADDIINVEKLADLIENRKTFSDVTVLKFDDSKHVQHKIKHPAAYERMIDGFVRDIIEQGEQ